MLASTCMYRSCLNRDFDLEGQLQRLKAERTDLNERGLDGFAIKQKGVGFYINRSVPLDETSPMVRSFIATTDASKTPFKWINSVIGFLRTQRNSLYVEKMQREIATAGPSVLLNAAKKGVEGIDIVPNKFRDDWSRVVDFAREARDPATK